MMTKIQLLRALRRGKTANFKA